MDVRIKIPIPGEDRVCISLGITQLRSDELQEIYDDYAENTDDSSVTSAMAFMSTHCDNFEELAYVMLNIGIDCQLKLNDEFVIISIGG